ncbi:MAG: DUF1491 family protein [Pseudomonadota bacterium]
MRLATHVWVGLLLRRVSAAGGFAMVLRKGEAHAGSVLVIERLPDLRDDGRPVENLFMPAPTAEVLDDPLTDNDHRVYDLVASDIDSQALALRLEREARFDPDHWVVELEGVSAANFLRLTEGSENTSRPI